MRKIKPGRETCEGFIETNHRDEERERERKRYIEKKGDKKIKKRERQEEENGIKVVERGETLVSAEQWKSRCDCWNNLGQRA